MEEEQATRSPRERRIAARKAQILAAAARIFAKQGFHNTTTREIAHAAQVSEGTIYNYFDSKNALLIGIMSRLAELEQLDVELLRSLQESPRDFFVAAFDHRMERILHGERMLQAVLPEIIVNPELRVLFYDQYVLRITRILERYLHTRVERGEIAEVDVPLTVRAMQATFVGLLILRVLGDEPLRSHWEDVPEVLARLFFDGLGVGGEGGEGARPGIDS
jgi:AcrR family transcriptional regulator